MSEGSFDILPETLLDVLHAGRPFFVAGSDILHAWRPFLHHGMDSIVQWSPCQGRESQHLFTGVDSMHQGYQHL